MGAVVPALLPYALIVFGVEEPRLKNDGAARQQPRPFGCKAPVRRTLPDAKSKINREINLPFAFVGGVFAVGLQSYVAKYEGGERRLDIAEFLAVCDAIGVDQSGSFGLCGAPTRTDPRP